MSVEVALYLVSVRSVARILPQPNFPGMLAVFNMGVF